jgi:hypothetical protein
MESPDQIKFYEDVASGPFRIGVADGNWDLAEPSVLPPELKWPRVVFWISALPRDKSPEKFYLCLDCQNYPIEAPTGTFWDQETKTVLDIRKRPKGKNRVAMVFRTDWEEGRAFYHPYDRVAANSHADWPRAYPHLIWDRNHTIVDLLSELHPLLHSSDYLGIENANT